MLTHGKTAEHHYVAMVKALPTLSELGASSITISHYAFDGAVHSAMRNLMHARHAIPHMVRAIGDGEAWLRGLLDWQVYTRCACHDGSKALEWSLKPLPSEDTMRDLFIVVESLRNGYVQLFRHLTCWICEHLVVDDEPAGPQDVARRWLSLFGIDPNWAERLAALDLRWDGTHLRANILAGRVDRTDGADMLGEIHACILHVWRFKKFSAGRWTSVSSSSRSLLAAVSLGLDSVVAFVCEQFAETSYYLSGYNRFIEDLRRVVSIASTSGWVADQLVEAFLEDDRVALRSHELSDIMK